MCLFRSYTAFINMKPAYLSNFFSRVTSILYRTKNETKQNTLEQLLTVLQPAVTMSLTEAVHSSGTKDALTQPIINNLVKLGQQLRKNNPEHAAYTPDEVQSILTDELKCAQGLGKGFINLLIDMDSTDSCIHFIALSKKANHLDVNIHKDTPTEILHTILLSIVKYYWGQTLWILEKGKQLELFQA
jgi:hypothetical protein